ncbi:MAG TPA: flagellar biosynthetic protein FliR [Granulicella sp.]|nr:flagellar biosynthetic protein FliR [Granulicella sp.]
MSSLLILIRISGMMVFVSPFSSKAIPARIKMLLSVALTFVVTPIAAVSQTPPRLALDTILGELSVGLLLGICVALLEETLSFAGYLLNLEFSFSLVNVLDPSTNVQSPLMSQFTGLILVTVLFCGGYYRVVIEALFRTMVVVPVGHARFDAIVAPTIVNMLGGILLAGLQLASPIMAATFLVQVAIALVGKLSPSLPVMIVGIPLKTLTGFFVLIASLGLWPRFIDSRFSALLDAAMQLMQRHVKA